MHETDDLVLQGPIPPLLTAWPSELLEQGLGPQDKQNASPDKQ